MYLSGGAFTGLRTGNGSGKTGCNWLNKRGQIVKWLGILRFFTMLGDVTKAGILIMVGEVQSSQLNGEANCFICTRRRLISYGSRVSTIQMA